ncbi:DNA-directed RNA polymerase subunit N [Candidatus Pacearchaeota archaeon CG_4_9_14_0_2_um_filter_39_13]|nr:DNA-directed RNA polymerase subunit N [Candidatus Pacearchaeota archaeon]OIO43216.1 MAG: DNA-directed RNA polymerase subunit N [Candidatus Pacearchaeota archaeon CG1_02_39_14]PJC44913.1 MAG: DNA-directed RNA polymerase subunit N [Candidatus Pacearchaeota archaeon CG_4_9_14_0_2_um_filter_39_13]
MIIPVRCFSCGKPIAQLWEEYKRRTEAGEEAGRVLNDLGLQRYCCRSALLGHADMLPEISKFKKS